MLASSYPAQLTQSRLKLKLENVSLQKLFAEIEKISNFSFVYSVEDLKNQSNLDVDFVSSKIEDILDFCFKGRGLEYNIIDNHIIIKQKIMPSPVTVEKIVIKGKVTDRTGNPLPGATIIEKETKNGCSTDLNGDYTITVRNSNSVIQISYIGFQTQEVRVGIKTVINVILNAAASNIEEVIVIGYGSVNKERIGSAVSQINSEEIEEKAVGALSFEQILGGQIKGVQISQSNGAPGSNAVFRIRGITSPFMGGNNQPLYVINGIPFNTDALYDANLSASQIQNPLMNICPSDVESITVLKDAAATAIYGSRGANGVILISLKRGKRNMKISTTLDYCLSINNPIKKLDLLDAEGFKNLHRMIAKNTMAAYAEGRASSSANKDAGNIINPVTGELRETLLDLSSRSNIAVFGDSNTNWQNEVYRENAATHQWHLDMNGGDDNTNFSLGISHTDQQPLMQNSSFKRTSIRLGVDSEVNKWLKIGSIINYAGIKDFSSHQASSEIGRDVLTMRPDYSVYDETGAFQRYPSVMMTIMPGNVMVIAEGANPRAALENENISNSTSFYGNAYVETSISKCFKLHADLNISLFNIRGRNFQPLRATLLSKMFSSSSSLYNSNAQTLNTSLNIQGIYSKQIKNHSFDAMLGVSWDRSYICLNSVYYMDFIDDYILTNASSASTIYESIDDKASSGINSIYSRVQYSYERKYTATLNFRSDKSSKFGPGNKVAYFPSIAINWNIDREKFMKNLSFVNKLILRTSYGKSGSANVPDFAYTQFFEAGSSITTGNEYAPGSMAIIPSSIFPNTNIRWETTKEFNGGVDFSFFSNHLYGSLDLYNKYTNGILVPSPFLQESGAASYTSNLAEISNKGWELEIGADLIRKADIGLSINFNISANRNKVENMDVHNLPAYDSEYYTVGEPVGVIKGYRVEKIIQTREEIDALNTASPTGIYYEIYTAPGDYLFKDLTGDKRITAEDQEVIGCMQPDYFGGFSSLFRFKRFSLGASFQYSIGNEATWNNYSSLIGNVTIFSNALSEALTDTWTTENTNAKYTRLIYGNRYNTVVNDAILQDASYLRLKILRVNYNIPDIFLDKLFLKSASLYVSATNLLTITKFKGVDPEAGGGTSIMGGSDNRDRYPYSKTFSFGIKIGL
jgi:TonB-linked SusC/RagA family outer membrane protein